MAQQQQQPLPPQDTLYSVCVGFYDNRQLTVEQCGLVIMLMPCNGGERPQPGCGMYTYKWSCLLDASGTVQEACFARSPRDGREPGLQAVVRLGEVSDINSALHTIYTIMQQAVRNTSAMPRSTDHCPAWLSYVMKNLGTCHATRENGAYDLIHGGTSICPHHLWEVGLAQLRERRASKKPFELPINFIFFEKDKCHREHFYFVILPERSPASTAHFDTEEYDDQSSRGFRDHSRH